MKFAKYTVIGLMALSAVTFTACNDDELAPGNPVMDLKTDVSTAHFGDSLKFVINASDAEVPLSTIHADLYYGDELVTETVIRTKVSGQDYEGTLYLPYHANIPDGRARLHLTLQNIHFTTTETDVLVKITHAEYPYLTFVLEEDGSEYRMELVDKYVYAFTGTLPQKAKGFIVAPKVGENGNELKFGYQGNKIVVGGESAIPFSNSKPGKYTVSFNTFSFEGAPFVVLKFADEELIGIDDDHAQIDINLTKGQNIKLQGFNDLSSWYIDPDYFTLNDDESLTFLPASNQYRVIADQKLKYFRVYPVVAGNPMTLNDDGSGCLWIIGDNIGKPSVAANKVGWTTENALAMAQISDKVYQMTVTGGKQVSLDATNFKFFGQMGWGVELKGSANFVEVNSDLIGVGDGNGHDDGNLYLLAGKTLKANVVYKFTVDLTGGVNAAKLTVTEDGEEPFAEKRVYVNDQKMTTSDNVLYTIDMQVEQGGSLEFRGISGLDEYYLDPDYFIYNQDGTVMPLAISGLYRITLDAANGLLGAQRLNSDGSKGTFEGDARAIWLMGWGVGHPSMDKQFGWTPGEAYSVAQIADGVYQFTGQAGPEHGSSIGQRLRTDYVSFKFFGQDGWGYEFSGDNTLALTGTASTFIKDAGNFELAGGVNLEEGATYVITVNVNDMTIDFAKK